MEKRVILAFVLSFVVLFAFRELYSPPQPPASTQNPAPVTESTTVETPKPPAEGATPAVAPAVAEAAENIRGEKAEEFTVDTPLYVATASNAGGVLKSFRLKSYPDEKGGPVELINQEAGAKVGWPLTLVTGDGDIDKQLKEAVFAAKQGPDGLSMEFAANGLRALKVLQFDQESYEFTVSTSLTRNGKALPHALAWQGDFGDQSIPPDPARKSALYQSEASFKKEALRSLKDETKEFTSLRAGVEDQYFAAVFRSPDMPMAVKIRKQDFEDKEKKMVSTLFVSTSVPEGKPVRVFVGPKQEQWLTKADAQLSGLLNYGWFGFIAKPLLAGLIWIHKYVGNYGWAIILLTIAVNVIIFPLRVKQQVSMLKMKKLEPQMRRLQDQYKKLKATDPRRAEVQSQMMGLYKEHDVNPMGGCLPLLLQMPLLLGFYSALAYSIELRRAPWILWIKDLSQYDPYFVIPILMAVAMIAQQKLTPTPNADPVQARMMMIMPIVMTFLFIWYSSGLALYWLTGSIVGVIQQMIINKYWSPTPATNARIRTDEPRGA